MSLGQLLADRDLHHALRQQLAPAYHRELLRAARALLERPATDDEEKRRMVVSLRMCSS